LHFQTIPFKSDLNGSCGWDSIAVRTVGYPTVASAQRTAGTQGASSHLPPISTVSIAKIKVFA